jgi:hypothetical protein
MLASRVPEPGCLIGTTPFRLALALFVAVPPHGTKSGFQPLLSLSLRLLATQPNHIAAEVGVFEFNLINK